MQNISEIKEPKELLILIKRYAMVGSAATIPFSIQVNRYSLILLALVALLNFKLSNFKEDYSVNNRILLIGGFALLNLFGLLYSEDLKSGFALLERTAIMLLLPVFIIMIRPSKKDIITTLNGFVVVCMLVCIFCILFSVWRMYDAGSLINQEKITDRSYYFFINNELSESAMNINPIYLSLYLNFCIAFLIVKIFFEGQKNRSNKVFLLAFHFFQVLLFSLSAVLALVVLWLMVLIKKNYHLSVLKKSLLLLAFIIALGFAIIGVYKIKPLHDRVFVSFNFDYQNPHVSSWSGITLRLAVWACALEQIKQAPLFGYGTGDVDLALKKVYKERNFALAEMLELNTHNQYFEAYLMHGLLGISFLFFVIAHHLYHSFREENWLLIFLVVFLALGYCTEVILSVQKGIIFFTFFSSLLYYRPLKS